MKTKNFQKKLVLKRSTITNLAANDLNKLKGGGSIPLCSGEFTECITICETDCATLCRFCPTELCM